MTSRGAQSSKTGVEIAPAEAEIRRRIALRGRIPFAEFMEIALYHRAGGYYSRGADGASGDYFTSSAAHPAFGALLALQAERAWEVMGKPHPFHVVEMGAGDGRMASDFVRYGQGLSQGFAKALTYVAIDRRRAVPSTASPSESHQPILADGVPINGVTGLFIANELLDAFPVHRFRVRSGRALELFVALDPSGDFVEQPVEASTSVIDERLSQLGADLPEGFLGEVNPGIGPWMHQVSTALARGLVVTIDYGHEARELYSSARNRGTLHTYFRHTEGSGPFHRIGSQDITAHVDFTTVGSEGDRAGLRTVGLLTQADYLKGLGWTRMAEGMRGAKLSSYDRDANMVALRELIRPEGLGGFKVLVQEKSTGIGGLDDLAPLPNRTESLETPVLRPEHAQLFAARYPHQDPGLESLWPFGAEQPDDQGTTPK